MRITDQETKAYQMLDSSASDRTSAAFSKLLAIMAKLRDPNGGCPWDLEQSFRTIVPHTIEEAYEVADAIEQDDMEGLKAELGDLLFQTVFYAQMAREAGTFAMADVIEALNAKMIKRHPHVFGDLEIADAAEQTHAWERQKAEERAAAAAARGEKPSALDGVTGGLPALTRALKLQNRAARVGFAWPGPAQMLDKIAEETAEIRQALEDKAPKEAIAEEIGDLMFALVNLARWFEIDGETALRAANRKFERRFRRVEEMLAAQGKDPAGSTLDEMEAAWAGAKTEETLRSR
jgi:ATP diphosphatase